MFNNKEMFNVSFIGHFFWQYIYLRICCYKSTDYDLNRSYATKKSKYTINYKTELKSTILTE